MSPTSPTSPRKRSLWRSQDGVTLIVVLGVMLVTSMLVVTAFTAANGEIRLTKNDRAQKKAYYAAEAGVEDYEYHLTQDGNYLSYCTSPPVANPALNQVGETTNRATVPSGAEGTEPTNEQYAIQLLPAESDTLTGDHKCDPNHLVETMLEEKGSATGTFRIESTGYAEGQERSIVATFRNANFVSYVWYTKFETGDPSVHGSIPAADASNANYWTECGQFYGERPAHCSALNNYFGTGESVNGPMHTEDHVGFSCKPVFGRTPSDRIEFRHSYGGDEGDSSEGQNCGTEKPTFLGTHIPPSEVPSIEPPPGDEELDHIVETGYRFEGKTEIILEGSLMTIVKNKGAGTAEVTEHNVPFPKNGVIFVAGGCELPYSPFGPAPAYSADTACGNVYVHGNYTSSLTIASENDVVINGNITTTTSSGVPTSNAMLGLIANNFVRVYHPVALTYAKPSGGCKSNTYVDSSGESHVVADAVNSAGECAYTNTVIHGNSGGEADACDAPNAPVSPSSSNATPGDDMKEPVIDAAILALKHSFIVDNFDCGSPELGHLNVYGAIAGLYTDGLTGVISGTTVQHGYGFNLQYDNRLQVEEPPHFLNPIEAAWYIQRQTIVPN